MPTSFTPVAFRRMLRDFFGAIWNDLTSPQGLLRGRGPEKTPNGAEEITPHCVEIYTSSDFTRSDPTPFRDMLCPVSVVTSRRYCPGELPMTRLNTLPNALSDSYPTAAATTASFRCRPSRIIPAARTIRHSVR